MYLIPTFNVRDYTVEFPTTVNGHLTKSTGFIVPHNNKLAQFFIVYDNGTVGYDVPEQVPQYLKRFIERKFASPKKL